MDLIYLISGKLFAILFEKQNVTASVAMEMKYLLWEYFILGWNTTS